MKRILQVVTIMNRGGIETMLMNYYRAIDRTEYQFDFLVHRQERGDYDDEIESMGGKIYRAFPIRPWAYAQYAKFLDSFFKFHAKDYIAIHCHIQDNSGFPMKYAAKYGIKNRLCTSHIAEYKIDGKLIFRKFGQWFLKRYVTIRLACGEKAGALLYKDSPFYVVNNAIDSKSFKYNEETSISVRREREWNDKIVIGNVARFCQQKNHRMVVDVFAAIHSRYPNSVLVLVGKGGLENDIKQYVRFKGLYDYVFFEGLQADVSQYLSLFDIFLFPSYYEGLPLSVIEAQASGLKCFLSDTIDKTTDITGNVTFISLKSSPEYWAEKILSSFPYERVNCYEKVVAAGYDIYHNVERLQSLYNGEELV